MTTNKRLLALDIMRGITIAGMILVNNAGSGGNAYAPLKHADWNGLTPTDLVFPFFMFIMGISTYFSLRNYQFKFSWPAIIKILRRTIVILLIGWAIAWLSLFLSGMRNPDVTWFDAVFNFGSIRILGVLPRLALCYGVSAILALLFKEKTLYWLIGIMLIVYSFILVLGDGFEFSEVNVLAVIDQKVLGADHMYTSSANGIKIKFDPEGLVSTLPSIAHCLIGFLCGAMIVRTKDNYKRVFNLMIIGAILIMVGFLFSYALPINKKVWSPTFVLTTCGLAASLLGLLIWIIDIKGKDKWCPFFHVFGINPLFLYVFASVLSIVFNNIRIAVPDGTQSLHYYLYERVLTPLFMDNLQLAALSYALMFIFITWCTGLPLYKKKIYIKI